MSTYVLHTRFSLRLPKLGVLSFRYSALQIMLQKNCFFEKSLLDSGRFSQSQPRE